MSGRHGIPIPLSPTWLPPELMVREKQLGEIRTHVGRGRSVYIAGDRATGKTVICKFFQASTDPSRVLYVKCMRGLLTSVRNALSTEDFVMPRSGAELGSVIVETYHAIILDDLHEVKDRLSLYWIKDLYDQAEERGFSLLVTSLLSLETWKRQGRPVPEIQSRYDFAYVPFAPYDAEQLYLILKQRAELVFEEVDDDALRFIAAKGARWRDVRLALHILSYAYGENPHRLERATIERGWVKEKKKYWADELTRLGHDGLVLFLIARITAKKAVLLNGVAPFILTHDINQIYSQVCQKIGVEPLFPAELSKCLTRLELADYIERHRVSYGNRGQTSQIKLLFDDPGVIEEAGKDVEWERFVK